MVIKFFLHILLHFGTNLAARINGTTIGGVAGVYITYLGCNRKTPMVELVTINKHCREIARTLKKISSTKQIKARTCCRFLCTLGYSWSLTMFRMRGMRSTRTWELHQLHTWYLQLAEYTWRYRHHTLGFWCRKAQKSKCGGDRWAPLNRFIPYQGGAGFALLEKKRENKKRKNEKREKIYEWKNE